MPSGFWSRSRALARLGVILIFGLVPFFVAHADTLESGVFRIEYTAGDETIAKQSFDTLEGALREFGHRLKPGTDPITVRIASDLAAFNRDASQYMGSDVSGISKSWKGLIVVKAPYLRRGGDDYHGTLRHELVHVLLYRNTGTGNMPRWLNEGICMSLANEFHWAAPLHVARMFFRGGIIEYRLLDRALTAPDSGMVFSDAYAQSLSMTRYLRDTIGEEKFWALVYGMKTLGFGDALRKFGGISPKVLWDGYRTSLWWIALIGALTSGSLMTPAALLAIVAWAKRSRMQRKALKRMGEEERLDDETRLFSWDDVVEDPDAWKGEDEDA